MRKVKIWVKHVGKKKKSIQKNLHINIFLKTFANRFAIRTDVGLNLLTEWI